jgi:hypothetical protein
MGMGIQYESNSHTDFNSSAEAPPFFEVPSRSSADIAISAPSLLFILHPLGRQPRWPSPRTSQRRWSGLEREQLP